MSLTKTRMTEEEFMRLPDDGRKYELVDGEAKPVPEDEIEAGELLPGFRCKVAELFALE